MAYVKIGVILYVVEIMTIRGHTLGVIGGMFLFSINIFLVNIYNGGKDKKFEEIKVNA